MENLARFETSETSAVEPVIVRAGRPTHISNDYFEGTCFLFVRDPAVHVSTQDTFCRRYFEIQLQGRFKRTPERFFIGLELSEVLRLSMLMRGVCNTLFNFVRSYEPDICVSFGSAKGGIDYEMPHLVSPYFKGCDIVVETPDGEAPPTLGTDITGGRTHPKGGRPIGIRLDCTYTICTFSTCIDPFAWKVKGTPVGTVDIGSVIGRDTAIRIVMPGSRAPLPMDSPGSGASNQNYPNLADLLAECLFSHIPRRPHLVVLEFGSMAKSTTPEAVEAIVRALLDVPSPPAIVFLSVREWAHRRDPRNLTLWGQYERTAWHRMENYLLRLCQHYRVSCLSYFEALAPLMYSRPCLTWRSPHSCTRRRA
ncbi:hypothetical protein Ctob_013360 [Chrysochromulina tobinii]|uniref:Domain of unknown function at the cortex 1 domain-containing protein n=1 Tax=Chrysochromulina tobinii TaxID=1460289 RepID=A0A0M0K6R9_9EUKA|nr:hypothetical protein Ctob_013360 [Chrysochromulina tobinii]|eukprot:KOO34566.1 hypothetical protein Ctob_013360 [Chrysochromulina sp. CCMP291]